jgi:hypothetical protein
VADQDRNISADDKLADELGVLVNFLDPGLKARRQAKSEAKSGVESPETFAPWSARKALFFFLFATSTLWLAVLGVVYLLFLIF